MRVFFLSAILAEGGFPLEIRAGVIPMVLSRVSITRNCCVRSFLIGEIQGRSIFPVFMPKGRWLVFRNRQIGRWLPARVWISGLLGVWGVRIFRYQIFDYNRSTWTSAACIWPIFVICSYVFSGRAPWVYFCRQKITWTKFEIFRAAIWAIGPISRGPDFPDKLDRLVQSKFIIGLSLILRTKLFIFIFIQDRGPFHKILFLAEPIRVWFVLIEFSVLDRLATFSEAITIFILARAVGIHIRPSLLDRLGSFILFIQLNM